MQLGEAIATEVFKRIAEDLSKASDDSADETPVDESGARTFSLSTTDGILVVTLADPDADVQVLDAEGTISITRSEGDVPITIAVIRGTHLLKFQTGTSDWRGRRIEIEPGGTRAITAELVLPDDEPEEQ